MDSSALTLALALAALALAGFAAARAYVPPQRRSVSELVKRVDDLEHQCDAIEERITVRARKEGMAQARSNHEQRATRRNMIEEQAAELIIKAQQPAAPSPLTMTKDQLRAAFLAQPPSKAQQ